MRFTYTLTPVCIYIYICIYNTLHIIDDTSSTATTIETEQKKQNGQSKEMRSRIRYNLLILSKLFSLVKIKKEITIVEIECINLSISY